MTERRLLLSGPDFAAVLAGRKTWHCWPIELNGDESDLHKDTRYRPGDKLWFPETWADGLRNLSLTGQSSDTILVKWRSPATMPRWAARLFATVKEAGFMRARDIGTLVMRAYGIDGDWPSFQFRLKWYARHPAYPLEKNQWVEWVLWEVER